MTYKYGDTIRLKDDAKPQMSLDADTFFSLSDEEDDNGNEYNNGINNNDDKIKTYWGLPEDAFETDDMGYVYLKSEYAKRLVWGVDDVTRIHDDFGGEEYDRLNINVAFDPEGVVNSGAFCSFVNDCEILTEEHCNIKEGLGEKRDDDMVGKNKRVVCKKFGAGEIISFVRFGQLDIAFVKFDGSSLDGTFVLVEDLKPELDKDDKDDKESDNDFKTKRQDGNKGINEIDDKVSDTERKLAHTKEMERIQMEGLALTKEIEDMSNETLVEAFENLIRNGAGPGYRGVVFMKRDMLRRMNRGDHL